jgi:hypothetical protein
MLSLKEIKSIYVIGILLVFLIPVFTGCVSNLYSIDANTQGFTSFNAGDSTIYNATDGFYYIKSSQTADGRQIVLFQKYSDHGVLSPAHPVQISQKYSIDPKLLVEGQNVSYKQGFNVVGLVVPFKYRLGSDPSLSPSSTIGPSAAYTYSIGVNTQFTFALFGGVAAIPLSSINSDKVDNRFGLSYGMSLVLNVYGNFQLGAVYGFDLVDKSINWQYNNKPWVSFGIGYKFLNF